MPGSLCRCQRFKHRFQYFQSNHLTHWTISAASNFTLRMPWIQFFPWPLPLPIWQHHLYFYSLLFGRFFDSPQEKCYQFGRLKQEKLISFYSRMQKSKIKLSIETYIESQRKGSLVVFNTFSFLIHSDDMLVSALTGQTHSACLVHISLFCNINH